MTNVPLIPNSDWRSFVWHFPHNLFYDYNFAVQNIFDVYFVCTRIKSDEQRTWVCSTMYRERKCNCAECDLANGLKHSFCIKLNGNTVSHQSAYACFNFQIFWMHKIKTLNSDWSQTAPNEEKKVTKSQMYLQ